MFNFLKQTNEVSKLLQLPRESKRVVFYSEGSNYWVYLSGIVKELIKFKNIQICYVSSEKNDPGLEISNGNFHSFFIDQGYPCQYLFQNIKTDVMVMTTPDLQNFHLKISKNPVHYIYIQHSLVSLHMAYNQNAFNYFDSIFCSGPHHKDEIRQIIKVNKLQHKNIIKHGYRRLDDILELPINRSKNEIPHVLIAPSWGKSGVIESIGRDLVRILLENNFKVTLRPHPQTLKFSKKIVDEICLEFSNNNLFFFDSSIASINSLVDSDLMISDWSGAALDYSLGLKKPILFIDVPKKINNPNYEKINLEPIEARLREDLGEIIRLSDIALIPKKIRHLLTNFDCGKINEIRVKNVYNLGSSDKIGAQEINKILNTLC